MVLRFLSVRARKLVMELKLCSETTTGLKRLGNTTLVNEEVFTHLLTNGVRTLTQQQSSEPSDLCTLLSSKGDILKEAHTALLTVFVEAARFDTSAETLRKYLSKELNWTSSRSEKLIEAYVANQRDLQKVLSNVGQHPPHVVDVRWRLDYCIKSNSSEHMASPMFLVQLVTDNTEERLGDQDHVKFMCTLHELQDFVLKLKDALRQVERVAYSAS